MSTSTVQTIIVVDYVDYDSNQGIPGKEKAREILEGGGHILVSGYVIPGGFTTTESISEITDWGMITKSGKEYRFATS